MNNISLFRYIDKVIEGIECDEVTMNNILDAMVRHDDPITKDHIIKYKEWKEIKRGE